MKREGAAAALILAAAWLSPPSVVFAQAGPGGNAPPGRAARVLVGEPVALKTKDGWSLAARHHPARPDHLTFILLHQAGGRKEDWFLLARAMARRGLGVFALDLRGHGASRVPPPGSPAQWREFKTGKSYNEWGNMLGDVEAAVAYLGSSGVAESSIALGGADVGSSIALKYAAIHRQVPMVFLLSPGMSYREVLTVNAMRAYSKRPILMVVAADDRRSTAETAILHSFANKSAGPEYSALLNVEREHGTRMLGTNAGLISGILDWVRNPIQPLTPSTAAASGALPPPGEEGPDSYREHPVDQPAASP